MLKKNVQQDEEPINEELGSPVQICNRLDWVIESLVQGKNTTVDNEYIECSFTSASTADFEAKQSTFF